MQENARTFSVQNLGKLTRKDAPPIGVRLLLDLIGVSHMKMKNSKGSMIEEVQITHQMTRWAPSLATLTGFLTPDPDMVNFFTIEMARGALEIPPYIPFVTGGCSETPWMPTEPMFARARETWEKLQTAHRRPSNQPISFHAFVMNYLGFALAGDLASAWARFGGLAAKLYHLGTLLSIATTENAMAASPMTRPFVRSLRPARESASPMTKERI